MPELSDGPAVGEMPGNLSAEESNEAAFDSLFARVTSASDGFGHREHIHLTWLAVHEHGVERADALVKEGLHRVARYARQPQKFNATMSRAWVLLIAHHIRENGTHGQGSTRGKHSIRHEGTTRDEGSAGDQGGTREFAAFLQHNAALLDKRLLLRFYRSSTLASPAARSSWLEPDLAPLPGTSGSLSALDDQADPDDRTTRDENQRVVGDGAY